MFKCIEVKDPEMIKEIYRFRADITCDELKSVKREDCIDGMETDEFDKYSIQYAIFDENKNIAACVRLIYFSKMGYPTYNHLNIYPEEKKNLLPLSSMGELSRIFIKKEYRGMKSSREIIELLKYSTGIKMKELGIMCSFGALEESFMRLLHILKMPYKPIGPYQMYGNRLRAPCIMYTDELIELNKEMFFETVC